MAEEIFKQYPALPLGLEYIFCDRPHLCLTCGGVVSAGEQLVRRSKYVNRLFDKHFMKNHGMCLGCSKQKMALTVVDLYESLEKSIKAHEDSTDAQANPEMTAVLEQMINSCQSCMEALSEYVAVTNNEEVSYDCPPEPEHLDEA